MNWLAKLQQINEDTPEEILPIPKQLSEKPRAKSPLPVELDLCRYDLLHKTSIGSCHPETCYNDAVDGACQYDDPDDEERAKHPGIFADKQLSSLFKVR